MTNKPVLSVKKFIHEITYEGGEMVEVDELPEFCGSELYVLESDYLALEAQVKSLENDVNSADAHISALLKSSSIDSERIIALSQRLKVCQLKIGAGVKIENVGYDYEPEREPVFNFDKDGCLTSVKLVDISIVSKRKAYSIAELEAVGIKVEQPAPVAVAIDIESAAKKIAERMDYPWECMPEQGRNSMRENAKAIVDAAMLNGVKP